MSATRRRTLAEIEQRVLDVTAEHLAIPRHQLAPHLSIVEDLRCDSLDFVELIMSVEDEFQVSIPAEGPNPIYKSVFTRQPFCLSDLAELVYMQQGAGRPERASWSLFKRRPAEPPPLRPALAVPFTQLDGRWRPDGSKTRLFETLGTVDGFRHFRRRSDGMRCVRVPAAAVEIGGDSPVALPDERPKHVVQLDSFLIDAEPVSVTAYCRFLNSADGASAAAHEDWFVLSPEDKRSGHVLVTHVGGEWRPRPGSERWPMILVSWYGANAYSLWANGEDWRDYRDAAGSDTGSFLPTEAQWEYAARGERSRLFPWGDGAPTQERMQYGRHRRNEVYQAETLPLVNVNVSLGLSPFGLHHMAGNVWQWCRDWYAAAFYQRLEAVAANPANVVPTGVRSERGGSWIGPPELCRSSYRRGRPANARGRCLGFRCVSRLPG